MVREIGCSENYIKKCFMALCEIGIIRKLGNVGRNGTLYADGYYVPYGDIIRKQVFLKDSWVYREGLRNLDPLSGKRSSSRQNRFKYLDVSRDQIVKASVILNESGLSWIEVKTDRVWESTLRDSFMKTVKEVPEEKKDEIPLSVIKVYKRLSDQDY
jgi:hypothetical protein